MAYLALYKIKMLPLLIFGREATRQSFVHGKKNRFSIEMMLENPIQRDFERSGWKSTERDSGEI